MGRIITRCTQDINAVDEEITRLLNALVDRTLDITSMFFSSILFAGVSALLPGAVVIFLGGFLGVVYLRCQLSIRRHLTVAKAPVVSQVGTTLAGLRASLAS